MILKSQRILSRVAKCCKASKLILRSHHAVVVGCYKDAQNQLKLTQSGQALQSITGESFNELLAVSKFEPKVGKSRSFFNLHADYPCITVAGLGSDDVKFNKNEGVDQQKENIRVGIGGAIKSLNGYKFNNILVDGCGVGSAAAEGATLSNYTFDTYKSNKKDKTLVNLFALGDDIDVEGWRTGLIAAESQNYARDLMETPSNYKHPYLFAELISQRFSNSPEVEMFVRDEEWAEGKGMGCFLSVGRGSVNRSAILELHYKGGGCGAKPIVLVGKGVTFDSGGISIKPSRGMGLMRGDMGGAACVLSTLDAIVKMKLPVNLIVLAALAENMPSGSATKPGDVFTAMNGKTVEVDNTDAEGRLVLADTLCYAHEFDPAFIINAATLTGAMDVALGAGATGAFTTCNTLWSHLDEAGRSSGDRMWRMPLFGFYTKQMECSLTADLRNTQKSAGSAGSCTAAAFLKEFVSIKRWAHLDIAGVMAGGSTAMPYLSEGMTGRPTRTIIEAVRRLSDIVGKV